MESIDSNGARVAYAAVSDEIVEALGRETEFARGLPNEAFTTQAFLDLENQTVFSRSWVFAGPASDVPDRGDVKPMAVAGRSLFMARGQDDEIRVFQNVCPHRGTRLVTDVMRRTSVLTCPYHAWSYGLDGHLVGRPHYYGPDKHDRGNNGGNDRVCLFAVRSATWHDWVFVNLDGKAPAFEEYMAPVISRYESWDVTKPHFAHYAAFEFRCNWKLAVENFCDSYHVFKLHPALHQTLGTELFAMEPDGSHLFSVDHTMASAGSGLTVDEDGPAPPIVPTLPEHLQSSTPLTSFCNLFPNVAMNLYLGNLSFIMFEPVGSDHCTMHQWYYFVGDAAHQSQHREARENVYEQWAILNAEDEGVCQRIQEGRSCDAYDGGRLSPYWDTGTVHFQRQIAAAIRGEGAFERRADPPCVPDHDGSETPKSE